MRSSFTNVSSGGGDHDDGSGCGVYVHACVSTLTLGRSEQSSTATERHVWYAESHCSSRDTVEARQDIMMNFARKPGGKPLLNIICWCCITANVRSFFGWPGGVRFFLANKTQELGTWAGLQ